MSKKIVFISGVSGVGKTTICKYINDNHLLDQYMTIDIDELENINDYHESNYHIFYENAIKKAIDISSEKNIILASCINPTDFYKINILKRIDTCINILITCSREELENRLKQRESSRNCSDDEFIKGQIEYQNYMLKHLDLYHLHLDNTNNSIETISNQIVKYINENLELN